MLQDNALKEFIASGFACCNKLLKDGTKCNCALRVIDTTHDKSCGIFTVACTKVPSKSDPEPHTSTFKTQFWCDNDYTLNRLAVTAEFVTGGSLTQLHQKEDLLKLAKTADCYYWEQTKRVAAECELQAKISAELEWGKFWELPFDQRIAELDARHDSARNALHSTFEVLGKATHTVFYMMNVETRKVTNNAWKNEDHAMRAFLDRCYEEKRMLCMLCHDSCRSASTQIKDYNEKMTVWCKANKVEFVECVDANDMWHGTKSLKKHITKGIECSTKLHINATKTIQKENCDDTIEQHQKSIAKRQLDKIYPRLIQIFQHVCNACENKPELAWQTWQATTYNCLIKDDHTHCVKIAGNDCMCAKSKRIRGLVDLTEEPGVVQRREILLGQVEGKYNPYLIQERMARAAAAHGVPFKPPAPPPADAPPEPPSEPTCGSGNIESDNAPVWVKPRLKDPNQPLQTQLTHPLAIEIVQELRRSAEIHSLLVRHCYCVNTSFVESFHNVILIYAMKRKNFHTTYDARTSLALLDWNENILREARRNRITGAKSLPPKTFKFQDRLVKGVHKNIYWATPKESVGCDYSFVEGRKRTAEYYEQHQEHSIGYKGSTL